MFGCNFQSIISQGILCYQIKIRALSFNIKNLSLKEKISLVEDIWDEISNTQKYVGVSDEQKKELDSRLSKYKLNLTESKEWSIVREEIKSKL